VTRGSVTRSLAERVPSSLRSNDNGAGHFRRVLSRLSLLRFSSAIYEADVKPRSV